MHPVDPGLPAKKAVGIGSPNSEDSFPDAPKGAFAQGKRLDLEPIPFGETGIHAGQVAGKKRRLIPAGAGPDLDDGVAIFERIPGNQQLLELRLERGDLPGQTVEISLYQRGELRIGLADQTSGLLQIVAKPIKALRAPNDRSELRMFTAQGLESG